LIYITSCKQGLRTEKEKFNKENSLLRGLIKVEQKDWF